MSVIFHNPLLLFGLAGAILPILIHRITRKKAVVRKFPALRFLLQSQVITARPQRLKHLLLLALRILAVATLVVMMARPALLESGLPASLEQGAKVLILDNSLSMGYHEDRGRRYDVAKKAAKEALAGFSGQVAVIPTAYTQSGQALRWQKPEEALKALETIPISFERGNTTSAFTQAFQELQNLETTKEVLILSDLARSDWEGLDLTKQGIIPAVMINFLRIGGPEKDANFCIKDVALTEGEIWVGVPTRLSVTLSNRSSQSAALLVRINLSGKAVDQKSINLNAGQDGKAFFDLLIDEPGWVDGEIRLAPDRLPADDVLPFSLHVKEKAKVLVVDGDPKTSLKAGESYYLVKALNPGGSEGSSFLPTVITESEMGRVDMRDFDALFLLNCARPDLSRLASFLEMGRTVFLFLGNRTIPDTYNRFSLIPWQIQEINDLSKQADKAIQFDTGRGIPKFIRTLDYSLKNASFRTYFKVAGAAKPLLALRNQDPLLMEAEVGKSRFFLFASSADLDWNDLPLNAAYLPFIQGLVKEALGVPEYLRVGGSVREKGQPLLVGAQEARGIFQLRHDAGELQGVNALFEESDLAKMPTEELKKKFGAMDVKVVDYGEEGFKGLPGGMKELWPYLLAFLLAVLIIEMIYANVVPRLRKEL